MDKTNFSQALNLFISLASSPIFAWLFKSIFCPQCGHSISILFGKCLNPLNLTYPAKPLPSREQWRVNFDCNGRIGVKTSL